MSSEGWEYSDSRETDEDLDEEPKERMRELAEKLKEELEEDEAQESEESDRLIRELADRLEREWQEEDEKAATEVLREEDEDASDVLDNVSEVRNDLHDRYVHDMHEKCPAKKAFSEEAKRYYEPDEASEDTVTSESNERYTDSSDGIVQILKGESESSMPSEEPPETPSADSSDELAIEKRIDEDVYSSVSHEQTQTDDSMENEGRESTTAQHCETKPAQSEYTRNADEARDNEKIESRNSKESFEQSTLDDFLNEEETDEANSDFHDDFPEKRRDEESSQESGPEGGAEPSTDIDNQMQEAYEATEHMHRDSEDAKPQDFSEVPEDDADSIDGSRNENVADQQEFHVEKPLTDINESVNDGSEVEEGEFTESKEEESDLNRYELPSMLPENVSFSIFPESEEERIERELLESYEGASEEEKELFREHLLGLIRNEDDLERYARKHNLEHLLDNDELLDECQKFLQLMSEVAESEDTDIATLAVKMNIERRQAEEWANYKKIPSALKEILDSEGQYQWYSQLRRIQESVYPQTLEKLTEALNSSGDRFFSQTELEDAKSWIEVMGLRRNGALQILFKNGIERYKLEQIREVAIKHDLTEENVLEWLRGYDVPRVVREIALDCHYRRSVVDDELCTLGQRGKLREVLERDFQTDSSLDFLFEMLDGITRAFTHRITRYISNANEKAGVQGWLPPRSMKYMQIESLINSAAAVYLAITGRDYPTAGDIFHLIDEHNKDNEALRKALELLRFRTLMNALTACVHDVQTGRITSNTPEQDSWIDDLPVTVFSLFYESDRVLLANDDEAFNEVAMRNHWVSEAKALLGQALRETSQDEFSILLLIGLGAHPVIWTLHKDGSINTISNEPGAASGRGLYRLLPKSKALYRPVLIQVDFKKGRLEVSNSYILSSDMWELLKWTASNKMQGKSESRCPLSAQNAWHYILSSYWGADSKSSQMHYKIPAMHGTRLTDNHLRTALMMSLWLEEAHYGKRKRVKQAGLPSFSPSIRALTSDDGSILSRVQSRLIYGQGGWRTLQQEKMKLNTNHGKEFWTPIRQLKESPHAKTDVLAKALRGLTSAWIALGNIARTETLVPWKLDRVGNLNIDAGKHDQIRRISKKENARKVGWEKPYTEYSGKIDFDMIPPKPNRRAIDAIISNMLSKTILGISVFMNEIDDWSLKERIPEILPQSGLNNLPHDSEIDGLISLLMELGNRLDDTGFTQRPKVGVGIKRGLGGEKVASGHSMVVTNRECDFKLKGENFACSLYEAITKHKGSAGVPFAPLALKKKGTREIQHYPLAVKIHLKSRKRFAIIPNPDLWWDVHTLGFSNALLDELTELRNSKAWSKLANRILEGIQEVHGSTKSWEVRVFKQGNIQRFARLFLFYELMAKEVPITLWGTNVSPSGVAANANTAMVPFSYEHSLGYIGQILAGVSNTFMENVVAKELGLEPDSSRGRKLRYMIL
ncbi:MAG: hypothetical protein ACFFER_12580, partial [Candidatus Thorarchaeota archaeon]